MSKRVLLVEDDPGIVQVIQVNLQTLLDVDIVHFDDGQEGLDRALDGDFDLILLDVNIPNVNGFDICREIRSKKPNQPIVMLTARGEEIDKVVGLQLGADDYVTKPFSVRELAARIEAVLRRSTREATQQESTSEKKILIFGQLEVDLAKYEARISGKRVELAPIEFELLSFLANNAGQAFNREQLLERVWGYSTDKYANSVNVQVSRLRKKLEQLSDEKYLNTVRGVGYIFAEPEDFS